MTKADSDELTTLDQLLEWQDAGGINPFYDYQAVTMYEVCKYLVLWPLGLARLVLLLVWLLVCNTIAWLLLCCLGDGSKKPNTSCHLLIVRIFQRVLARGMLFCLGFFWIEVKGEAIREQTEDGKRLVIVSAPHCNFVDGLIVICAGVAVSPVAMHWVSKLPLLGSVFTLTQGIKVVRGGGVTALIQERVESPTLNSPPMIFPEGTTGNGRCLMQFKSGAFVAGAPVQPVVLGYPSCSYAATWSTASLQTLLARTMCQVFNRATVQVLPVVIPTEADLADPKVYARRVMEMMSGENMPMVPVSHSLCPEYLEKHGHLSPVFTCVPVSSGKTRVRPAS